MGIVRVRASGRARAYVRAHPKTKRLTGRRLANALKKKTYVLQTREFSGGTAYLDSRTALTSRLSAAERFSGMDRLSSVKLPYLRSVTGLKRLRFKRIK